MLHNGQSVSKVFKSMLYVIQISILIACCIHINSILLVWIPRGEDRNPFRCFEVSTLCCLVLLTHEVSLIL